MPASDQTFSSYELSTTKRGDFSCILHSFATFQLITCYELPFISEVTSLLQNRSIFLVQLMWMSITVDNVIHIVSRHTQSCIFHLHQINEEFYFIAEHFFKLFESQCACLRGLDMDSLQLNDEN